MRGKIVIAGCGFGGIKALDYLFRHRKYLPSEFDIIAIDKKDTFDFLPLAPDILAGWLNPDRVRFDLAAYFSSKGAKFIKGVIVGIDPVKNSIQLNGRELDYDYLILSSGSEINFFGNQNLKENCLTLNSIEDALKIRTKIIQKAKRGELDEVVVVGGGYTGLEAILNIDYLLRQNRITCRLKIIEKSVRILNLVPEPIRNQVEKELSRLGVRVLTSQAVRRYENNKVFLESGEIIDKAICLWSAGVKAPSFIDSLDSERINTRLKVNPDLTLYGRPYKNIFVIGDNAAFLGKEEKEPLRMAVMFSLGQAKIAAQNILNSLTKRKLSLYRPQDLGYLIPLVYARAPGVVFGCKIPNRLGYFLHYILCIYRSKPSKIVGMMNDLIFFRMLKTKKEVSIWKKVV